MREEGRGNHTLLCVIHQNNVLARKALTARLEDRSVHTKGLGSSLGQIQVAVTAERALMSQPRLMTSALTKPGTGLLPARDTAVLASSTAGKPSGNRVPLLSEEPRQHHSVPTAQRAAGPAQRGVTCWQSEGPPASRTTVTCEYTLLRLCSVPVCSSGLC